MTARVQVRHVRLILSTGIALRAVMWGVAVALSLIAAAAIVDLARPLALSVRSPLVALAVLTALGIAAALAWRDRAVLSERNVALWIEERFPSLEYVLITAVESGDARSLPASREAWASVAARRVLRALAVPIAVLAAVLVVILLVPNGAVARVRHPHPGDALEHPRRAGSAASRLTPLVGRVVPPAYSREAPQTIDEPTDIRALVGSMLTLQGQGDGSGVVAHITGDSSEHRAMSAESQGERWAVTLRVPARPVAVELKDRNFTRVVVVEGVPDAPPVVTLVAPAHDSVLRIAHGQIRLSADAKDDFGIDSAAFEYIISSGEGETFTFRSGVLGAVRPHSTHATLTGTLLLDGLGLNPGDIVHVRAVARDGNTVSGPGVGVSETRSIRIARSDEYDSVSVDAAAPSDADRSLISERMLISLTEALDARRTTLPHDTLVKESQAVAVDQKALRRSVGELVFIRLGGEPTGEEHSGDDVPARAETMAQMLARADAATNKSSDPIDFSGGESPVVAVNKPLLEAYNAMWDASMSLDLGGTRAALPHMRRALEAIQRARKAERVYLRGAPPPVIVDVEKVRLTGKDKGASSTRRALAPMDSASRHRADRFARVVDLAARDPQAAVDSLLMLRIAVVGENPPLAAALNDAATAMRRGRSGDAAAALSRARRALAGVPTTADSLARWGIVP